VIKLYHVSLRSDKERVEELGNSATIDSRPLEEERKDLQLCFLEWSRRKEKSEKLADLHCQ
jgi:hypothetical protein